MDNKKVPNLMDPNYWKKELERIRNPPLRPPFQHPGDHKVKDDYWKPGPHPPQKE